MSTVAAQQQVHKPRMGRVPIVPWVRCARCKKIIAQRHEPWRGDPFWVMCHNRDCRTMNRVSEDGVWAVEQAGDMQPLPPR